MYNTMLCFFALALFTLPLVSSKAYCTYHMYTSRDSLTTVACSDGANGIMTKFGYNNISPMFPYVTAFSGATWNSPRCGQCVQVSANGRSVFLTVIDQCGPAPGGFDAHFDIAPEAFREVFGDAGVNAGVQSADWQFVASHLCRGNKGNSGGQPTPKPNPQPNPRPVPNPVPNPPSGGSRIRCGRDWSDANNNCGTSCTHNGHCNGQRCYADLKPCGSRAEGDEESVSGAFEEQVDAAFSEQTTEDQVFENYDQVLDAAFFEANDLDNTDNAVFEGNSDQVFENSAEQFDSAVFDQSADSAVFYDAAMMDNNVYDAATAPTDSTLSTASSGLQGWVIGLFVLFSIVTVLLIVVIVQIVTALRK